MEATNARTMNCKSKKTTCIGPRQYKRKSSSCSTLGIDVLRVHVTGDGLRISSPIHAQGPLPCGELQREVPAEARAVERVVVGRLHAIVSQTHGVCSVRPSLFLPMHSSTAFIRLRFTRIHSFRHQGYVRSRSNRGGIGLIPKQADPSHD
jgi:hypothetical protein